MPSPWDISALIAFGCKANEAPTTPTRPTASDIDTLMGAGFLQDVADWVEANRTGPWGPWLSPATDFGAPGFNGHDLVTDPGDQAEDDYEWLNWACIIGREAATRNGRDEAYAVYLGDKPGGYLLGGWLEVQSKQTLYGSGMDTTGDVTGAQIKAKVEHAVEYLQWKYIGDTPPATDPIPELNAYTNIINADGAEWIRCVDLQFDGREYVPHGGAEGGWNSIFGNGNYDEAKVSQRLRESPNMTGFTITNQGNRSIPDLVYLDNLNVHSTLSSCFIIQTQNDCRGQIWAGNSVSGRPVYRNAVLTKMQRIWLWGCARSSMCRHWGSRIGTLKFDGKGPYGIGYKTNSWNNAASNWSPGPIFAAEYKAGQPGDIGTGIIEIDYADFDFRDSDMQFGFNVMSSLIVHDCWMIGNTDQRQEVSRIHQTPSNDNGFVPEGQIFHLNGRGINCTPPTFRFNALHEHVKIRFTRWDDDRNPEDNDYTTQPYDARWSTYQGNAVAALVMCPLKRKVGAPTTWGDPPYHPDGFTVTADIQITSNWHALQVATLPQMVPAGTGTPRPADDLIPHNIRYKPSTANLLSWWTSLEDGDTQQSITDASVLDDTPVHVTFLQDAVKGQQWIRLEPDGVFVGDDPPEIHQPIWHIETAPEISIPDEFECQHYPYNVFSSRGLFEHGRRSALWHCWLMENVALEPMKPVYDPYRYPIFGASALPKLRSTIWWQGLFTHFSQLPQPDVPVYEPYRYDAYGASAFGINDFRAANWFWRLLGEEVNPPAPPSDVDLVPENARHQHVATSPTITYVNPVVDPEDARHDHRATQATLVVTPPLDVVVPQYTKHRHEAQQATFVYSPALTVENARHEHRASVTPTIAFKTGSARTFPVQAANSLSFKVQV